MSSRARDERVLLLPLTAKDGATTAQLLSGAGVEAHICTDFDQTLAELAAGAAVMLLAEERMTGANSERLAAVIAGQPPWSDLPVLLVTRHGADSPAARDAVLHFGNVTLLERPLRIATLLSAVQTAIRARTRQYQIRGHLEERERATEALRAADRRKDEFLATLGHELRNPLAPLLTGVHLLRLKAMQDPAITQMTDVMERQVSHLVRLVDDLLEVSRITRGVIDVQREPIDLGALLRAAVESTRPMFDGAGHELAVDIPDEPLVVSGDAVRLTQVFANLLTNAAKYTNHGGRIWVTAARVAAVRNGSARATDRVVVRVRDSGIGIAAEHLSSVFEMFTQVDRASRRSQGGLGIGLTLVRSLVQMHGGEVTADSAGPGTGSEFTVSLPLLASAAGDAPARADTPQSFPARRILVVDDNEDAADTLGTLLATLGATVEVAHGGEAALAALEPFAPDTVLLDIGMPEIDGYEVARRIRADKRYLGVLLIALTGWGQDQDFTRSREAGFDHHLVKPPDIRALRELLSAVDAAADDDGGARAAWSRPRPDASPRARH
jgi:signal transduction histidine kinase/ActR/RegA family two-component response regulator